MDYLFLTNQYYSMWVGQDNILNHCIEGIHMVYSPLRNQVQKGYGHAFDLYILLRDNCWVISYGDQAASRIDQLKQRLNITMSFKEVIQCIEDVYQKKTSHSIKYVYQGNHLPSNDAIVLTENDAQDYLAFFKKCHPDCTDTSWVHDYFMDMVLQHSCCGVRIDHQLVSCTDAPDVPFMQDLVQEIGISTLLKYQGHGYASDACCLCVEEMVRRGKCPLWSTSIQNIASQKLAHKVGFMHYADCITLTL